MSHSIRPFTSPVVCDDPYDATAFLASEVSSANLLRINRRAKAKPKPGLLRKRTDGRFFALEGKKQNKYSDATQGSLDVQPLLVEKKKPQTYQRLSLDVVCARASIGEGR